MVEDHKIEEQTISLGEIFNIIKKYFLFLVIITAIAAIIAAFYAFEVAKPKYRSSGDIFVEVVDDANNVNVLEGNRRIPTVMQMVTSTRVLLNVQEKLANEDGINLGVNQIKGGITLTSSENSLIFTVNFTSGDSELAQHINQLVLESLFEESQKLSSLKDSVIIHTNAQEAVQVAPNKLLLIFVGALIGGVVGLVIVFVRETVTSGYKTREELEKATRTIVLGTIPTFKSRGEENEEEKYWFWFISIYR